MTTKNCLLVRVGVAFAIAFLVPIYASADDNDPPTRVARLAYAEGSVAFQPGGTDDWVAATINRPLTTGDQLWSDSNSRAELQLDGSLLRLAASTAVTLLNVGDNVTQIQLSTGTLLVRVRRLEDNETYEIDTPNLAFSILRPGLYRVSVDESGASTAIRVHGGQGEVTGGGTAYMVQANEDDVFSGSDQLTEYAQAGPANQDGFDVWSANRDSRWEHSMSSQYVSPDIVGYEDLDEQGTWRPMPEYGNVWFPTRVEVGWAPYHNGHWSYIAPWGYTWVDDQPWGFAPFHYGRWVSVGGVWGWIPAPPRPRYGEYVRPVYAPALVAWVGVGTGVAWFALGPREVYVPSYPVSRRYVDNINVSNTTVNTTVINNVYNTTIINNKTVNVSKVNYINRNVPGAVAATTSQAFNTAQPVSRNLLRVDQRTMSSAPIRAFAPATVPTKQAVLGSAAIIAAKPPAIVQTRAIVVRAPPPPAQPTFANREQAIRANAGQPLSVSQVRQMQVSEAPRRAPIRIAPAATPIQSNTRAAKPAAPASAPPQADLHPATAPAAGVGSNRSAPVPVHPNELPAVPMPASPSIANSALEREHLQQQQQLRAQQDAERQKAQQQQELAHQQLANQHAEEARKQQIIQQQQAQQLAQQQQQRQQQTQQLAQQQQQHAQQEADRQRAQQQQQDLARQQQSRQQADEARRQQIEQQHQQETQQLAQKHALEQEELQKKQQEERRVQEAQTKPAVRKDTRPPVPNKN
jgi:DNA segregation ATPase FtsK/SpoIIIE-like protein